MMSVPLTMQTRSEPVADSDDEAQARPNAKPAAKKAPAKAAAKKAPAKQAAKKVAKEAPARGRTAAEQRAAGEVPNTRARKAAATEPATNSAPNPKPTPQPVLATSAPERSWAQPHASTLSLPEPVPGVPIEKKHVAMGGAALFGLLVLRRRHKRRHTA
jgi:hypothetical protein